MTLIRNNIIIIITKHLILDLKMQVNSKAHAILLPMLPIMK